ncbi:MAG: histidine phosphatase family protein [Hyphomicrobium sp.]|nr:histidine phosphatase family protein [Hyphomicrobium sp.]
MRLDLLRHGDTGRAGYLDGRTDSPLLDAGYEQMHRQTLRGGWPVIIASPLQRARRPAEAIASRLGCELEIDADWSELDLGLWDGRQRADIEAVPEEAKRLAAYYRDPHVTTPPGGECWEDFAGRIHRAVSNTYLRGSDQTLVVTHAGCIRMALSIILGLPMGMLWSVRIGYGTRIGLDLGQSSDGQFWGELIEIAQP